MALRTLLSSKNYSVTKVIYFIKELTFDNLLASTILSSKRVIFKLKAPQGVTLQSRGARRYEWRPEVRGKRSHGLGVRTVRLES